MRRLAPALLALCLACSKEEPRRASLAASAAVGPSLPVAISAPVAPASASTAPLAQAPEDPHLPAVDEAVLGAITRGEVKGAVVLAIREGAVVHRRAYGLRRADPPEPMTADTVFDLASLTKPLATAASVLLLQERGKLRVTDAVARHLPAFAEGDKGAITIEQLLIHTSGLPADHRDPRARLPEILAMPAEGEPDDRFRYSDIGYLALGALVEKVSGEPLDAFARENVFQPLGMTETTFNPGPELARRAAPTEARDGRMLEGVVHDPRARLLGGVAGHAGLFSTADDLARFARALLPRRDGAPALFKPATLDLLTTPRPVVAGVRRTLGFGAEPSSLDAHGKPAKSFGHTGFTGTSIWIDPASDTAVIILASRLYPDGKGDARRLRRDVQAVFGSTEPAPPAARPAQRGIDVLERTGFAALQGRKVGLVTNAAAVDQRGQTTLAALRAAPGVTLAALFTPEHGLAATAEGPQRDGKDEATGLPVYSLHGARARPTARELAGLDTLVVDLQDVGARFYTYATTVGLLLEAAKEGGVRVVVLDRPNPLGGLAVEGPLFEKDRPSPVAYHPIPLRHGMTLGELATLFNGERSIHAELEVIRAEGWHRGDPWTGPFRAPSPNLRTLDEAFLYPGVALVEQTNVSVGRGTDRPFEQVGAPYLDGPTLARALEEAKLPGVGVASTSFTPTAGPFQGEECHGVRFTVTDRARLEPIRLGFALVLALHRLHPSEWKLAGVDVLLRHRPTMALLEKGEPLDRVLASFTPDLAAFAGVRRRYLLYPE